MPTDAPTVDESPRRARYDPAFREAVEAGHLTTAQAYARGKREVYAAGLVRRYRLPQNAAYAVADNRKTLAEARQEKAAATPETPVFVPTRRPRNRTRSVVVTGLALALAITGWQWWANGSDAAPATTRSVTRNGDLVLNSAGEILRVIGQSPEDVLGSFCKASQGSGFEPFGLMPASSESAPVRIGLLRDRGEEGRMLAIAIRLDRSSRRWYAGDGLRPVKPKNAPPGAVQAAKRH